MFKLMQSHTEIVAGYESMKATQFSDESPITTRETPTLLYQDQCSTTSESKFLFSI